MIQILFNSGASLNLSDALANLGYLGTFTQQLPQQEIRLLVDTSAARTVILPATTDCPVRNVVITILDINGNALTKPITVNPTGGSGDTINGNSSQTINVPYGTASFSVLSTNAWYLQGGNLSGGGDTATFINFQIVIPNATALAMLADSSITFPFIPALGAGNIAEIATVYVSLTGGTVPFSATGSPLMRFNSTNDGLASGSISGITKVDLIGNALNQIIDFYGSDNVIKPSTAWLLSAAVSYTSPVGDCDIIVFGSYQVKNIIPAA